VIAVGGQDRRGAVHHQGAEQHEACHGYKQDLVGLELSAHW